jgi:hypothetical protein
VSTVDVHTADQAPHAPLLDFEGQTTLLTGDDLPVRVVFDADAPPVGLIIAFRSDTAPAFNVWDTVQRRPRDVEKLWRRDHGFVHQAGGSVWHRLPTTGTPIAEVDDQALVGHAVLRELLFKTILDQWRSLVAERWGSVSIAPGEADPRTSAAWNAFEELSRWLELSHGETAELLGLGRKTAYGWRREGHPPQPRLARRLYQAHAFVRQLVLAVGDAEARTMLSRGGEDSALALVADNRVAEAESRFADLIYRRPHEDEAPLGASRSGDDDVEVAVERTRERLPGGRRRVELRRGR